MNATRQRILKCHALPPMPIRWGGPKPTSTRQPCPRCGDELIRVFNVLTCIGCPVDFSPIPSTPFAAHRR
jgi:hypothetical protein